jgi:hypothetical protein
LLGSSGSEEECIREGRAREPLPDGFDTSMTGSEEVSGFGLRGDGVGRLAEMEGKTGSLGHGFRYDGIRRGEAPESPVGGYDVIAEKAWSKKDDTMPDCPSGGNSLAAALERLRCPIWVVQIGYSYKVLEKTALLRRPFAGLEAALIQIGTHE